MAVVESDRENTGRLDRRASRSRPPGRSLGERLSVSVVAGLVAALLAFVLVATLLRDRRAMISVAVAGQRIPAGATITPEMVHSERVPALTGFADELVGFGRVAEGLVATRTVQPGEPLTKSSVGAAGSVSGQRVMSIPVDVSQAAGGQIQVGDQIDVIETTAGGPRYVLVGALVVDRSGGSTGGAFGATRPSELVVTVEVDAREALALAAAIASGKIVLVRSTGATPIDTSVVLAPSTTAASTG